MSTSKHEAQAGSPYTERAWRQLDNVRAKDLGGRYAKEQNLRDNLSLATSVFRATH
jgi:hypothetical protein